MAKIRAEDPSGNNVAIVLQAWPVDYLNGATATELVDAATAYDRDNNQKYPDWLEAIKPVARNKAGNLNSLTFGQWMAAAKDRMVGNRKLCRSGTNTRPQWKVEIG